MPDALLEVYEMVEVTYVRGRRARGRRPAVEPRFPPPVWNAYEAVIHEYRTSNMMEGYHNKFRKSVQAFHTRIWRFLEAIKIKATTRSCRLNFVRAIPRSGNHKRIGGLKFPPSLGKRYD